MPQCPSCEYPLPDDRESVGARCPSCRDPIYEPPTRNARPVRQGETACVVHAASEAVGNCGRCGNPMCEVCRTSFRDLLLCAACVDRALEAKEGVDQQARAAFRQAATSLGLAGGAWVLFPVAYLMALIGGAGWQLAAGVLLFAGVGVALFGVGQAAALLRMRRGRLPLAAAALVAGSLFVGLLIGFAALVVYLQV
jgi:hypothetical protein